jgi:pantoate--beta-alanine ligase
MKIITSNDQLKEQVNSWRLADESLAFVPTMGNLHRGHLKLIEIARQNADHVVVSVFVNPMQFNQDSDFANYPRTLEQDIKKLNPLNIDVLYCPDQAGIYPEGMESATKVIVPELSEVLCGEFRPGHFEGVATVVAKLFNLVQPQVAVFGEKDFQQLLVIRKLVRDLNFPISIIGVETEREESGLALSSRNQYLSDNEKQTASQLYRVLKEVAENVKLRCQNKTESRPDFLDIEQDALSRLAKMGFTPEYVQVRNASDIAVGSTSSDKLRVFAAAWLGQARLIDNVPIALP